MYRRYSKAVDADKISRTIADITYLWEDDALDKLDRHIPDFEDYVFGMQSFVSDFEEELRELKKARTKGKRAATGISKLLTADAEDDAAMEVDAIIKNLDEVIEKIEKVIQEVKK